MHPTRRCDVVIIDTRIGVCEGSEDSFIEVEVVASEKVGARDRSVVFNTVMPATCNKKTGFKTRREGKAYSLISAKVKELFKVGLQTIPTLAASPRVSGWILKPSGKIKYVLRMKNGAYLKRLPRFLR